MSKGYTKVPCYICDIDGSEHRSVELVTAHIASLKANAQVDAAMESFQVPESVPESAKADVMSAVHAFARTLLSTQVSPVGKRGAPKGPRKPKDPAASEPKTPAKKAISAPAKKVKAPPAKKAASVKKSAVEAPPLDL